MATSVHVHDHVNVHELRPRLTLDVDAIVDVHVDVIGFFHLRGFAAPGQSVESVCIRDLLGSANRGGTGGAVYCGEGRDLAAALSVWE